MAFEHSTGLAPCENEPQVHATLCQVHVDMEFIQMGWIPWTSCSLRCNEDGAVFLEAQARECEVYAHMKMFTIYNYT